MKLLQESFSNLKRNRFLSLASIISIGLILLIFNVLLTVNQITRTQIENLSQKINLSIYLSNNVNEAEITQVEQFLRNLPEVENVKIVTKEEALKQIEGRYPDSSEFLDDFNIENPLPNSLQVQTVNLQDQNKVIQALQTSPFKDAIFKSETKNEYNKTIATVVKNLINIRSFSFQIILWVMITFIIAGSLIMFNAIRTTLFTRRNEIQIMQFVGATFKKIMYPFILEGVLIGALGFFLNVLLILILNGFLPFSGFTALANPLTLIFQLIIAGSIGMLTSAYVVNKYLNTREIFND